MAGFSGGTLGASKRYTDEQISLYGTTGFTPKGSWSAATNTPHLEDGVGTLGWVYEVIEPGTQFGYKFLVGDKVFYNASNKWDRSATGVESEAPMVVAYVDENTESFPTTRPSGQPLKNGDYVSVKSTAILPFEIENISGEKIPFDAYGDKSEFNGEDWQEKSYEAGKTNEIGIKNPVEEGVTGDEEYQNELNKKYSNEIKIGKSVISVKRLGEYLYEATYDGIADYVEGANPVIGGCTSFVRGEKTYRSFDLNYNNVAEFLVKTKDFDGIALIQGMNDGNLDKEKIAQLPYHLADGCNRHGIVVTEHILFNDFNFEGTGTKENDLTKLPTIILQNVKSMAELTTNVIVNNFLANAKLPTALIDLEYALHFLITDGTTTYTLCPKDDGSGYEFIDISALPKLTNFKWLNKAILERNDSDLQERPTGIERWNLIGSDTTLKDLRFTKAYETNERLSEFIGIDGTTKDSTDAELEAIYEEAHTEYLDRERDDKTWQSVHSIIYNKNGIESLCVQENYDKDYCSATLETKNLIISNKTEETISGTAKNQKAFNKEFVDRYKDIFLDTTYEDLDDIDETNILKRIYKQTTDTDARKMGYYVYNFSTHLWEAFGMGGAGTIIGYYKSSEDKFYEEYDGTTYSKEIGSQLGFIYVDITDEENPLEYICYKKSTDNFGYIIYGKVNEGITLPSGKYIGELFILSADVVEATKIIKKGIYRFNGSLWNRIAVNTDTTDKIDIIDNTTESLDGEAKNQKDVNEELVEAIKTLQLKPDVVDIVQMYDRGTDTTKTDIVHYDLTNLFVNDIVKVLIDETHDDKVSYYKVIENGTTKSFVYVASDKPIDVDNTTIDKNTSRQIQVKDNGISIPKLKMETLTKEAWKEKYDNNELDEDTIYKITNPYPIPQINIIDLVYRVGVVYPFEEGCNPNTDIEELTGTSWEEVEAGIFLSSAGSSGIALTELQEELPNIKADIEPRTQGLSTGGNNAIALVNPNGAFYTEPSVKTVYCGTTSSSYSVNLENKLKFNANKYNSIYKDGGVVRPHTILQHYWKRIA